MKSLVHLYKRRKEITLATKKKKQPLIWSEVRKSLKAQGPFFRFMRNFFWTGNAWGMFHINSHISKRSGKPKVKYNTEKTAKKNAKSLSKKRGYHHSVYKCAFCNGWHVGVNRSNKN